MGGYWSFFVFARCKCSTGLVVTGAVSVYIFFFLGGGVTILSTPHPLGRFVVLRQAVVLCTGLSYLKSPCANSAIYNKILIGLFCLVPGACWPPLRQPSSAQLLLGCGRFHLQVLRNHLGRSVPQGNSSWPANQLALQASSQAPRDAWFDRRWPQEPWYAQGPQIQQGHRWFAS